MSDTFAHDHWQDSAGRLELMRAVITRAFRARSAATTTAHFGSLACLVVALLARPSVIVADGATVPTPTMQTAIFTPTTTSGLPTVAVSTPNGTVISTPERPLTLGSSLSPATTTATPVSLVVVTLTSVSRPGQPVTALTSPVATPPAPAVLAASKAGGADESAIGPTSMPVAKMQPAAPSTGSTAALVNSSVSAMATTAGLLPPSPTVTTGPGAIRTPTGATAPSATQATLVVPKATATPQTAAVPQQVVASLPPSMSPVPNLKAATTAASCLHLAATSGVGQTVACSGNLSTIAGTTGDIAVTGSLDRTSLINSQTSAVDVAGGRGPATAVNLTSVVITDQGLAAGATGKSTAEGTTTTGDPHGGAGDQNPSQSRAGSGSVVATGLTALNNITNVSHAGVTVRGATDAPINVQSLNRVAIADTGAAGASSGDVLATDRQDVVATGSTIATSAALPNGRARTPRPPILPLLATSNSVTAVGLAATNTVHSDFAGVALAPVSLAPPVAIGLTQGVAVNATGLVAARSADTRTCVACAVPAPTAIPATAHTAAMPRDLAPRSSTDARSGAVDAQGLAAQNNVATDANVSVHIAGQNDGLIQVIIESITRILNRGGADAWSGDATATTGSATEVAMDGRQDSILSMNKASSGNVDATGARVSNEINLRASAAIHVAGDNTTPINVVLHQVVDLASRGFVWATSGRAAADASRHANSVTDGGSITAASGSARATGLDVRNQVYLAARISVDIDGSNYAPIYLEILQETDILNEGQASAVSGDVQAHGRTSSRQLASLSTNTTIFQAPVAGGSPGTIGSSSSGGVEVWGAKTAVVSTNRTASSGSPLSLPGQVTIVSARSGAGVANGVDSRVILYDEQRSTVSGSPQAHRVAANIASLVIDVSGVARLRTGPSSTSLMPPPEGPGAGSVSVITRGPGAGGSSAGPVEDQGKTSVLNVATEAHGVFVSVNPWASASESALPPIPGQRSITMAHVVPTAGRFAAESGKRSSTITRVAPPVGQFVAASGAQRVTPTHMPSTGGGGASVGYPTWAGLSSIRTWCLHVLRHLAVPLLSSIWAVLVAPPLTRI